MSERDSLRAKTLRAALIEPYIGSEIIAVEETTSTNDLAWQMAQKGKRDGLVVIAERQTAGRGQRGNEWESAAHLGLWLSILLRPGIKPADSARVTNWAVRTVASTIEEQVGADTRIKMPNDIFVLERKAAGVLVEMRVEKKGVYAAIVGIGVNVNHGAADFSEKVRATAGSLAMAAGKKIDRQAFALALLRNLDRTYRALFTA
jgi:BirA family biotin operon repressor/biotin-[acetyl-CoA-carboxylase] ligase